MQKKRVEKVKHQGARSSVVVSFQTCSERDAEFSVLHLMFMDFGDQWDVSEDKLHAAGSSLFWSFKKEIRHNINWIHNMQLKYSSILKGSVTVWLQLWVSVWIPGCFLVSYRVQAPGRQIWATDHSHSCPFPMACLLRMCGRLGQSLLLWIRTDRGGGDAL